MDFDAELAAFQEKFGAEKGLRDLLSYLLYPKVYEEYHEFNEKYGEVRNIPTRPFSTA